LFLKRYSERQSARDKKLQFHDFPPAARRHCLFFATGLGALGLLGWRKKKSEALFDHLIGAGE